MKSYRKYLSIFLVLCLVSSMFGCKQSDIDPTEPSEPIPAVRESFIKDPMIRNADGSYGGSLDEAKYGAGAPLNGQYDVADSDYYMVGNDYFNMTSHAERIIYPQFTTYQQTMEDSSGIACLLMVLNYMGQDVVSKYNEEALVKLYEQVNQTTVYGNGTTEEGLIKLVDSLGLGYTASDTDRRFNAYKNENNMKDFFTEILKEGKFVFVRYQSPTGYGWKLLIGYDGLANIQETPSGNWPDSFRDDVIILAEPNDMADHRQDGYTIERARDFYLWWRDMELNGKVNDKYSFIVVDAGFDFTIDYKSVLSVIDQKAYPIHLPGFSGALGPIKRGAEYYTINDFYNMGSEGSRVLLPNYTIFQQTMQATCGVCAVGSVLKYYGHSESYAELERSYMLQYEAVNKVAVNPKGTRVDCHQAALAGWGYESQWGGTTHSLVDPDFMTYESYIAFFRSNLLEGRPIPVASLLGSNHYYTVIGFDDMGTDFIYDDVFICADSNDDWDGYEDGYDTFNAYKFFRQHSTGDYSRLQNYIVIYPKN